MSGRSGVKPRPHAPCREKGIQKAVRLAQKAHLKRYSGAIAFFDLPGSTEMMKSGSLEAIRAMLRHNAICRAVIEPSGGRVIKELGDGVMAGFSGAGAAVECAIKVIQCVREHGEGMRTKAAVAYGTLRDTSGPCGARDVYGTPVHVSARMAEHAVKDTILIDENDKVAVAEWIERTGFGVRRTKKRARNYEDRILYAISVE